MLDRAKTVPAPPAAALTTRRDLVITIGSISKSFWRVRMSTGSAPNASTLANHRGGASVDRHGHADFRTARRRKASSEGEPMLAERRDMLQNRRAAAGAELLRGAAERTRKPGPGTRRVALGVRLPAPMSSALSAAAGSLGLRRCRPAPVSVSTAAFERFPANSSRCPKTSWSRRWSYWRGPGGRLPGPRHPNPAPWSWPALLVASGDEEPAAALTAACDLVVGLRRLAQRHPARHSHLERALRGEAEQPGDASLSGSTLRVRTAMPRSAATGEAGATPTKDPPSRTAASAGSSSTAASSTASKDGPGSSVTGRRRRGPRSQRRRGVPAR